MFALIRGVSGFQTTHIGSFLAQAFGTMFFVAHPHPVTSTNIVFYRVSGWYRFLETAWREQRDTDRDNAALINQPPLAFLKFGVSHWKQLHGMRRSMIS